MTSRGPAICARGPPSPRMFEGGALRYAVLRRIAEYPRQRNTTVMVKAPIRQSIRYAP